MKAKKGASKLIVLLGIFLSLNVSGYTIEEGNSSERDYVIGGLIGRLGNQLFEVATACALAWDNDADAYFPDFLPAIHYDQGYYRHVFFRCKVLPPSNEISIDWSVPPYGYFPIEYKPKMRLFGYCQNELYFAHHRDRLIELFAPHPNDLVYIKKKYHNILNHPCSVSVHVRNYLAEVPDDQSFIQYDEEYYEKAMSLFSDTSLFVVMSDDINFARKIISTKGRSVIFLGKEPYFIDFFLQSMCKHNIICNSTFSWWSAWLNQNPDKVVVRPKIWLQNYPDIGGPDNWIKIDALWVQARMKND